MVERNPAGKKGQGGYADPPVKHRFTKGKSGNPKGRPRKASPDPWKEAALLFWDPVPVKQPDGSFALMTFPEVFMRKLMASAIAPNPDKAAQGFFMGFLRSNLEQILSEMSAISREALEFSEEAFADWERRTKEQGVAEYLAKQHTGAELNRAVADNANGGKNVRARGGRP